MHMLRFLELIKMFDMQFNFPAEIMRRTAATQRVCAPKRCLRFP
jgi:hypothetical protein